MWPEMKFQMDKMLLKDHSPCIDFKQTQILMISPNWLDPESISDLELHVMMIIMLKDITDGIYCVVSAILKGNFWPLCQ